MITQFSKHSFNYAGRTVSIRIQGSNFSKLKEVTIIKRKKLSTVGLEPTPAFADQNTHFYKLF